MKPPRMRRPYITLVLALAAGPAFAAPATEAGERIPAAETQREPWLAGAYRIQLSNPDSYLNCRVQPALASAVVAVLGHGEAIRVLAQDGEWLETGLGCFVTASDKFLRPVTPDTETSSVAVVRSGDPVQRRIGGHVELSERSATPVATDSLSLAAVMPLEPHSEATETGEGAPPDPAIEASASAAVYQTEPVLTDAEPSEPAEGQKGHLSGTATSLDVSAPEFADESAEPPDEIVETDAADDHTAIATSASHWLPGTYAVVTRQPRGRVNCRDLPATDSAVFVSLANGDLFDVSYVTKRKQPWLLTEHECFVMANAAYLKPVHQDVPVTQMARRPPPVPQVHWSPETAVSDWPASESWSLGSYRVELESPAGQLNCRDMPSTRATIFRGLRHGETVDANFIVHTKGVWLLTTEECFIKANRAYLTPTGDTQTTVGGSPPGGHGADSVAE